MGTVAYAVSRRDALDVTEEGAIKFLKKLDEEGSKKYTERVTSEWAYESNITKETMENQVINNKGYPWVGWVKCHYL